MYFKLEDEDDVKEIKQETNGTYHRFLYFWCLLAFMNVYS
jgi:hypothetical protein